MCQTSPQAEEVPIQKHVRNMWVSMEVWKNIELRHNLLEVWKIE